MDRWAGHVGPSKVGYIHAAVQDNELAGWPVRPTFISDESKLFRQLRSAYDLNYRIHNSSRGTAINAQDFMGILTNSVFLETPFLMVNVTGTKIIEAILMQFDKMG